MTREAELLILQVEAYAETKIEYKNQVQACLRSPRPITHGVLHPFLTHLCPENQPLSSELAPNSATVRPTTSLMQFLTSVNFRLVVLVPRRRLETIFPGSRSPLSFLCTHACQYKAALFRVWTVQQLWCVSEVT